MAQGNLKSKAASGMLWTAIQKYSGIFITFISGIILARLLTPHDYGCIGMLSIFMVLADSFIDGGFGSALIQKKNPTQVDFSTIFYWNLGVALFIYAILFVSAPAIARFYDLPILSSVLRVQALVLFVHAFALVQSVQLKKKLNFKIISVVSVSTSLISLTVTIMMAYKGFGVWALVAQNLISATIPAIVYWFYIKWRPIRAFSWASFKELFSFGFYMFLTHIINNFSSQVQGLLIGKVYDAKTMGYYSKAIGTERLASHSISSIMTQVTYPLYAQVQDDKAAMTNMVRRLTMTISYITFPLMILLILTAKPLFLLLYSDRWLESVPYFQVLCISGLAACLISVNTQTIAAIGKSKVMFAWTLIKRLIGLGFVVGGLIAYGMKGLLAGLLLNTYFSYFVNIGLVSKYIGYKWIKQLLDIAPVAVVAIISGVVSYLGVKLLDLSLYPAAILKVAVYLLIYLGWSFIFKPEAYTYTLSIIPGKFKFFHVKNQNSIK